MMPVSKASDKRINNLRKQMLREARSKVVREAEEH